MAERESPSPAVRIERKGTTASLYVDQGVYCGEAVLRALHWYTDRLNFATSRDAQRVIVIVSAKKEGTNIEPFLAEFENALLDAQLRIEIGRETAAVRELIVAKAFAEGDLLEDPPRAGDWRDPVASTKNGSSS